MTAAGGPQQLGKIVTFYSYKGGTGRSMALANVAWVLASSGKRVLAIDWDLEAPGLHRYFEPFLADRKLERSTGVIDFVRDFATAAVTEGHATRSDWYEEYSNILAHAVPVQWDFPAKGLLHLVPAGKQDEAYAIRVNSFDWQSFYERLGGGILLEGVKRNLRSVYDIILIDSRTGVSDTSGICTIQMPDELVVCYTLNRQSIYGASFATRSAMRLRRTASGEPTLKIWPVPTRIDKSEKDRYQFAAALARARFSGLMHQLKPEDEEAYWGGIEVGYEAYYAYEEVLAIFKDLPRQTSSILAKMEAIAAHLNGGPLARTEPIDEVRKAVGLAAFTTGSAEDYTQELIWLGDEYESIVKRMPAGEARTELMTLLVGRAQMLGGQRDAGTVAAKMFNRGTDGGRVIGLSLARIDPEPKHIELALSGVREMRSAFEQYHALLLAETLFPSLDAIAATELRSAIISQPGATIQQHDPSRWVVAQRLVEKLDATTDHRASSRPNTLKPLIFISYAHADEPDNPAAGEVRWLSFVMEFLRPGVKGRKYEVWIDRLMAGGADWNPEIEARLRDCDIFILLVSARSTGSDYIIDKEIPIVRERQRNGDDFYFYPLLLDWTPKAALEEVNDKNLRPRDAKPFSSLSPSERSRQMAEVADEITDIAKAIADRKIDAARGQIVGAAETATVAATGPAAPPALVAISGLPETFYERLVGRDAELDRLDEAWSGDKTNIVSLIAEGGAGKSALVNEWLIRLRADRYRGADCVLGWSFYSQGSKERATAADAFLDWALAKLGLKLETRSASAKSEAIAEALMKRRALLVLDGVEPLQHGPGPQAGQLKDQGLRALLRRFAAEPPRADHSLIVLTSRLAVADIHRFKRNAAPVVDVERLSDEAGTELLLDNGVWGADRDLKRASHDFGGHPLALMLLARFLKDTQNGDVRRRDQIRGLLADADNPRHDQARRVMESYEREWLAGQPILLAILYCVGLFDRPASGDGLKALRARPAIPGLTDALVDLSEEQWRRAVARLRDARPLSPEDPSEPEALDAHSLVREWFGERLRQTNEAGWKAAHSRLYDHLRRTTREGAEPTLADLAPLYHAIAHGCRAGRYQEALEKVYRSRICRRLPDGRIEFYAGSKLGAVGSDLAAIAWFFDRPYGTPAEVLTPTDRAFVLGEASFGLRAQGRLQEALPPMRTGLQMEEALGSWQNAAISASNLSETELLVGTVAVAAKTAEKSVVLADRAGGAFQMMVNRTTLADTLLAGGEWEKAAGLLADAERQQQEWQPEHRLLYSLRGYQYCDLLLSRGRAGEARDRAVQTSRWAREHLGLLDVALDTLTLGRAHLALALQSLASAPSAETVRDDARAAAASLTEAVEGLRASGQSDHLARGLLARAAFRRAVGGWDGAARDLDEVQEIAEPGPMRLYLCDGAVERARLRLARREAFAPLNGLVEPSPPPPASPNAIEAARLLDAARKELDAARKLIAECGYHRRDAELAELDAVVAGKSRFGDLPPRV